MAYRQTNPHVGAFLFAVLVGELVTFELAGSLHLAPHLADSGAAYVGNIMERDHRRVIAYRSEFAPALVLLMMRIDEHQVDRCDPLQESIELTRLGY